METLLQVIALVGVSLVLGLEHAMETDHVVAVTTLTSQSRSVRHAVGLAALWGLGHTVTLLVVSLIVLLLRLAIPPQLATFFELLVGFVLVLLGANVIGMVLNGTLHSHTHEHDGVVHTYIHAHSHTHDAHDHHRRSFWVGIVHGLAGSTALILVVLSSFPSLIYGLVFIVFFGLGSVLGMCLITLLIAIPVKLSLKTERINQALQLVAGSAGVLIGCIIVVRLAFPA